ncbi:MAG: hypothetical protein JSS62_03150 [Verrucomicrobia bacterium]|nr:hypothetical protein [Verrucomicrobiota bacterium]MBS0646667.1 hypothetical protein [Verrucomicrobiota bacterium]
MSAVSGAQRPHFESPFVGFDQVEDLPQIQQQIERVFANLFAPAESREFPHASAQEQQDLEDRELVEEYHTTRAGAIRACYLPQLPHDAFRQVDSLMVGCLGTSDMIRMVARHIELTSYLDTEDEEIGDAITNLTEHTAANMRETIAPAVRTLSKLTTDDMLGPIFLACVQAHKIPSQFIPPEDEYSRSFCKGPANSFLAMDAVMNIFLTYDLSSASFMESLRLRRDTLGNAYSLLQSGHDLITLLRDELPNLDERVHLQLAGITPDHFQRAARVCQDAVTEINSILPQAMQELADNLAARFDRHQERPDRGWSRFL